MSARVALDQEVVTFGQRPQRARNAGMRGRLDQDLDDFLANPPQPQRGFDVLAQGIRRSADSRFRSDRGQQTELEVEARAVRISP